MRIRLLGPVDVLDDGGSIVPIGGSKRGSLLAFLALRHPAAASRSEIIDALWGEDPPETAANTVQAHVSGLRKAIGSAALQTLGGSGYRLDDGVTVDAAEFAALVRQAGDAEADDPERAATLLREALSMWRGPALADVGDADFVQREAARLEELRMVALERRIQADLLAGRPAELVAELEVLVAQHPWRERLRSLLMRALYHSGRQADALAAYDSARAELLESLGLDPSPELDEVYQRILNQTERVPTTAPRPGAQEAFPSGTLTFLMTDVVGSTGLWDTRPADMAVALASVEALIEGEVATHGGTLLKSRGEGDSTLSVFPSAPSAVAAAVRVMLGIDAAELPNGIDLSVRTAIHSGEAQRRDGDYFGGTLNRAARVRGLAHGGQILISDAAALLVEGLLDADTALEDLGVHELRGLARAERVHQVCHPGLRREFPPLASGSGPVAPLPTGTDLPFPSALGMFRSGPFAGREEQMERLRSAWRAIEDGGPRLAVVAGEPGIGKTRLVAEVAAELHESGVTVLAGRCTEDPLRPFEPFADALHTFATAVDPAHLTARLGRPGEPLGLVMPSTGDRETTGGGAHRPERSGFGPDRASYLDAVVAFLSELTVDAPAVLVIEDLHWATEPTLVVLRTLLNNPQPIPLLVLGTYRDTELDRRHPFAATLADLRRDERVTRMTLRGLDHPSIVRMLEGQNQIDVTAGLAKLLLEQTDGNPFFLGEILRHLAETDGDEALPEGVREVVGRRLSSLGDVAVKVLRAAAVLGPTFSFQLLECMPSAADDTDDLLDALDAAVTARMIVEERTGTGEYSFAHALVRQTVYEELSSARRTRLHGQALAAHESLHAQSILWLPAMAHHAIEAAGAGDVDTMTGYVYRAAMAASDRMDGEEMIDLSRRGLEVLQISSRSPANEARLMASLGWGLCVTGAVDEGLTMLRDAVELARGCDDPTAFAVAIDGLTTWAFNRLGSKNHEAMALLQEALDRLGDREPGLRAELLASMAVIVTDHPDGPARARRYAAEALDCAELTGDPARKFWMLWVLEQVLWGTADHEERKELFRRMAVVAADIDDPTFGVALGAHRLRLAFELGDADARSACDAFMTHVALGLSKSLYWGAFVALLDGDLDAASSANALALGAPQHPNMQAVGLAQAFMIMREQGRTQEAIEVGEAVIAETPGLEGFAIAMTLGRADLGQLQEATRQLDQIAERGFENLPSDMTLPVSLGILAELVARLDAKRHVPPLEALIRPWSGTGILVGHNAALLNAADRSLGQLAAVDGRLAEALDHYERAIDFEERVGAPALVARTRYWYARALLGGSAEQVATGRQVAALALEAAEEFGMAGLAAELGLLVAGTTEPSAAT